MAQKRRKKRHANIAPTNEKRERRVDPWLSLAQGIVLQAIFDWITLETGGEIKESRVTLNSLRLFFRTAWCETLLLFTDINPDLILEILEKELADVGEGTKEAVTRCNQRPTVAPAKTTVRHIPSEIKHQTKYIERSLAISEVEKAINGGYSDAKDLRDKVRRAIQRIDGVEEVMK